MSYDTGKRRNLMVYKMSIRRSSYAIPDIKD